MTFPCARPSERYVVAACLVWPDQAIPLVIDVVEPGHFTQNEYRATYVAIRRLWNEKVGVDPVAVINEVKDIRIVELFGWPSFIQELLQDVTRPETAIDHARNVRDAALKRELMAAAQRTIDYAQEEGASYQDVLAKAQAQIDALDVGAPSGPVQVKDILIEVFESIDGRIVGGNVVETGIRTFDEEYGAFEPGSMVVVAARPSVGKTTFASGIALHAARTGKKVLFFSIEVPRVRLLQNLICTVGEIDSRNFRRGVILSDATYEALSRAASIVAPLPLAIDDSPIGPLELRAKCLRHRAVAGGLDLVIVDYMGLMDTSSIRYRNSTRENEVAWLSRELKGLAKELNVPVIALSQLNRMSVSRSDHRPQLSDLRDSGCIEQDADVVLLLHREELCLTDPSAREQVSGQAELIVAKNRHGPTGTIQLRFDGRYFKFTDVFAGSYVR